MFKLHFNLLQLLGFAAMLGSCTSIPIKETDRLSSAAASYDSIELAMKREQVLDMLGPPQETEGKESTWETRYNRRNLERLKVRFDAAGDAQMIARRHYRCGDWAFRNSSRDSYAPSYYD